MNLNEKGYKLITGFEGLSLKPYLCPAKIPTIGYGNTYYPNGKHITLLDEPITQQQAFEMFKEVADRFALAVNRRLKKTVTQNQFNSLVSFAYNVGTGNFISSTLLKKVNINPNDESIKAEFLKWNKAGGKEIKGLTIRRNQEQINYYL